MRTVMCKTDVMKLSEAMNIDFNILWNSQKWTVLSCAKNPNAKDKWAMPDSSAYRDRNPQKNSKTMFQDSADKKLQLN